MSPSDRARQWFKRHAVERIGAGGQIVAYGVDWSEAIETSLTAEFAAKEEG